MKRIINIVLCGLVILLKSNNLYLYGTNMDAYDD